MAQPFDFSADGMLEWVQKLEHPGVMPRQEERPFDKFWPKDKAIKLKKWLQDRPPALLYPRATGVEGATTQFELCSSAMRTTTETHRSRPTPPPSLAWHSIITAHLAGAKLGNGKI